MINRKELNRCIDILSELNANATSKRDKSLILELGYIIKQELELANALAKNNNGRSLGQIDVKKLLEDNTQLFKENQALTENIERMTNIINKKMPRIQEYVSSINDKFNTFNEYITNF